MTTRLKKHAVLIGLVLGTLLLFIASWYYPGGSYLDANAVGYDWINNYLSNLLGPQAVNGAKNTARAWAIGGVLLLSGSFGLFFWKFAQRIRNRNAAYVIKYGGLLGMLVAFFTVVPRLHDSTVAISSILTLLVFFYITIFIIKSKLTWLKFISGCFLLAFYFVAYMYFARFHLEYLPLAQKVIFMVKIAWVLSLEYFTETADFAHIDN